MIAPVIGPLPDSSVSGRPGGHLRLDVAVADLYGDLRVAPLLARLLAHTRDLLGTVAGGVSIIDVPRGRYVTAAADGLPGLLGRSLPLDEGPTGQVFTRRAALVVDGCAAAPLWWQGEVIGANVAHGGRRRRFTAAELGDLELLTQTIVPALVQSGGHGAALIASVRDVVDGDAARSGAASGAECPLTHRERQVLRLLAVGLSDREVAARLAISPKTVEKHVGSVLRKSAAASRTAAVVRALERGWLAAVAAPRPIGIATD